MAPFTKPIIDLEILDPAKAFIDSLPATDKLTALAMIKQLGVVPHPPQLTKLVDRENRIYEVRGATKDFWIRMFWVYAKSKNQNRRIVITNGYLKKDNKTDPNEIKKANQIRKRMKP